MSFTILDLPTEVIAHIFSFVSQKKNRRNLALICKQFHNIVRQQSKKHNRLRLFDSTKDWSSLLIFEQSDEFPFDKLRLYHGHFEKYRGIWLRHGHKITQMTLMCKLEELGRFGSTLKELFPNLRSVIQQNSARETNSGDPKNFFSENIEELHLSCYKSDFKMLNSTLELFPGLKRLKLAITVFNVKNNEYQTNVRELKDLVDKWSPKLENIDCSFTSNFNRYLLFGAFDEWINENLSFEHIDIYVTQYNIEMLKRFFSVTRHIKSFEIPLWDVDLDSNLCALIDQNATIDRLTIRGGRMSIPWVEGLINLRGVKEIHIKTRIPSITEIRFTSEALLKVKEIIIYKTEDLLSFPQFRNLHSLCFWNNRTPLVNEDIELIVNKFPLLEDLHIMNVNATNGHPLANLKHLRSLKIRDSPSLSDAFFDFGAKLSKLEKLSFKYVKLGLAGVKSIVTNCPQIEQIHFHHTKITEECIDLIAQELFYIETIYSFGSLQRSLHSSLREKYPKKLMPCVC